MLCLKLQKLSKYIEWIPGDTEDSEYSCSTRIRYKVSHLLNMEDQLVENMEIDEDTCNYSSEEDDEVNELIREIFGDEESLEEEHEEEYEDGNEMWNETRENYEDEYSLLRERRFVVGEGALLSLIKRTTCEQCGESIDPSTVVEGEKIPAGVKYKFLCCNGHPGKWISTPFYGGRSFISILLQLMVLLTGASWEKFALGAKFINLVVGSSRQFYKMQLQYRTAIEEKFHKHISEVYKKLGGLPLSVAVDVRFDSPGFCASRSTAVFMDSNTKAIIHMEVGDSREVDRHSSKMERLLIDRGLQHLLTASPLVIWEIISDASRNIISLMKSDPYKHLQHSLDIWHKAKKLTTSLSDIAKTPGCRGLLQWIRPIVNHFWWCCSTCKGSVERLLKRWMGILYHINNKHVWAGGRCRHSEEHETECSNWLQRDTVVFKNLRMLVTNRDWCGSMKFYTNCRQTWAVENFFSHTLLHYCPKQKSYGYDAYHIRNMLAVMDHNNHLGRMPLVGQDGEVYAKGQVSRRTKQWVAYEEKAPKDFKYIPELMAACMRATYGVSETKFRKSRKSMSLDSIAKNLSGETNPGSRILLAKMQSRKKTGENK
uniref:Uncharacterized protein n=1 Tax=Magallana gigas TaxID=29159 RepID=A0A8W8NJX8_MAGGI